MYVPNSFPKHKNRIVKNNTKNTASVGELNKRLNFTRKNRLQTVN